MSETIFKLQPNRTMQLRGFDAFGAAAAMHSATENAFTVSGVFRDAADFAVLIAYDADNFYEHSRLKYLPDFDFDGLTLAFDVHYTGLRPLDSPRYETIDWPYLDVVRENNSTARIRLSENATLQSGTHAHATAAFTIEDNGLKQYDHLSLWYMNFAFVYTVEDAVECAYAYNSGGPGTVHTLTVNSTTYSYTEIAGDTLYTVNARMAELVDASPTLTAVTGPAFQVNFHVKGDDNSTLAISSSASASTFTLRAIGKQTIAANLAAQINGVNWSGLQVVLPLDATATNGVLTVRSTKAGVDGNAITMYSVAKNSRLLASTTSLPNEANQYPAPFSGGSSDCTWRVTLNFAALGVPRIRQMWFTFAPPLADGQALPDTEWQADFSNWTLTGPLAKRKLQVAGLDSVRVEENSPWCKYTGNWSQETGFYSGAFARRSTHAGDKVDVFYACSVVHDLYIGTTLYADYLTTNDRGRVGVRLDQDTETIHDFAVSATAPIYARRLLRSNVPAGRHNVEILTKDNKIVDFDFLEAAAPSDVPGALPARSHVSPALDYSTDHTFKLPPARIHWIFDQLGFSGTMNEYLGVFWWNQRKRTGATIPTATLTFNGTFAANDQIILWISGTPVGKTVFAYDSNSTIARHFAYFINATLVGVWASASGNTLTIQTRSPMPAYSFTFSTEITPNTSSGSIASSGSLSGGDPGLWEIDLTQSPPLNRAARDWHADFFANAATRNRDLVVACSMELVYPPAGFAAVYPDGQEVVTDVGFASLKSAHCTFNTPMRNYQKDVYAELARLQNEANLVPYLQFGEFLWWFFTNKTASNPNGGMACYDPETTAAALTELGRPLHIFRGPNEDPTVNGSADATFLRNRLRDHIAALRTHILSLYADARFELLYPYDVNHPTPAGVHNLGGAFNRFVNLPIEFEGKAGSGLDTLKMEALDFGAWTRSLDLAKTAIEFPILLGWPKDSLRYLVPVFRGGSNWEKEYLEARGKGIPLVNFWAHDHFNLYNLDCTEPVHTSAVSYTS
jgi:hypothetical protein